MDAPIVQPEPSHGQDVGRRGVQDEGGLQLDGLDTATLRAEPAGAGDLRSIEFLDDPRNVSAGRSSRAVQILSITCLTTV